MCSIQYLQPLQWHEWIFSFSFLALVVVCSLRPETIQKVKPRILLMLRLKTLSISFLSSHSKAKMWRGRKNEKGKNKESTFQGKQTLWWLLLWVFYSSLSCEYTKHVYIMLQSTRTHTNVHSFQSNNSTYSYLHRNMDKWNTEKKK